MMINSNEDIRKVEVPILLLWWCESLFQVVHIQKSFKPEMGGENVHVKNIIKFKSEERSYVNNSGNEEILTIAQNNLVG